MSKHHHHPHEGHGSGNPPKTRMRHTWFFYLAGIFILAALLCFIFSGNLAWKPRAVPTPTPATK